jgi:ribosomal protein L7/L12
VLNVSSEFWANVASVTLALLVVGALGKVWRLIRPPESAAHSHSSKARARDPEPWTEARARDLVSSGKKIEAIRMIRELRGITLSEAKTWADHVEAGGT